MQKKRQKSKSVAFSTTLTSEAKALLERYCAKRGIKLNHFVETAILEKLEDEMDAELINDRALEGTVDWKKDA